MAKRYQKDDFVGWCAFCKEDIIASQGFVFTKGGKYKHLDCYNQEHNILEEIDSDEIEPIETDSELLNNE